MGHADIKTTAMYYLAANDAHAERIRAAFGATQKPHLTDSTDSDGAQLDTKPASRYHEVA